MAQLSEEMKAPSGEVVVKDLDERTVLRDPIQQFQAWYRDSMSSAMIHPDAMALATVSPDGRPSARIVLLKRADEKGFVFYTNYESRKAGEIARNSFAAVVFYWGELQRQVHIEGSLTRISAEESDEYFSSRPRESQISALSSPQSRVIPSRAELERLFGENERRFRDQPVPRPRNWGGYILKPSRFEFWQEREARLHDRIEYMLEKDGSWKIRRLAP